MKTASRTLITLLCVSLTSVLFDAASTAGRADDPTDAETVNAWAKDVVQRLKLKNQETGQPLALHPGSLIRWTNPIMGEIYGDSYLWLDQGRPAAFLSIYAIFDSPEGNRRLTFQSLSENALVAELDGTVIWSPTKPGLQFQDLTSLPDPPANPRLQALQQRRIAQSFSGSILANSDQQHFRSLRLLSTPLLQYESPKADIASGSLFAMVDGTDPEILLAVEAHSVNGTLKWRYAVIRQNHRPLQMKKAGEVVWEAPALAPPFPNPKISDPAGIYYNTKWDKLNLNDKR